MVLLAEGPTSVHSSIYGGLKITSKRLVVLKDPGGLQEYFENLDAKVDAMTAGEQAVVMVVTNGALEHEYLIFGGDVSVRHPEPRHEALGLIDEASVN